MRVGGQSSPGLALPPEVLQVLLVQTAFQEGPRIDARCGVPLEIDRIARVVWSAGVEEMIEAHFEQGRAGSVGGNVPADAVALLVGPHHHGHGVPADDALDAPFDVAPPGKHRLAIGRDGIDVGGVGRIGEADALFLGVGLQVAQQFDDPPGALAAIDVIQGFTPLPVFDVVEVSLVI